jgi:hypothetical protein
MPLKLSSGEVSSTHIPTQGYTWPDIKINKKEKLNCRFKEIGNICTTYHCGAFV